METARPDPAEAPPRPRRRRLLWATAGLATLALAGAGLAAIWDWNWFRGPVADLASARIHRKVSLAGNLRVHLFSWQPSATVEGVRIGNPAWAGPGALADIDRLALQIRLLPLFAGRLDVQLLQIDRPRLALFRDAEGRASWDFSDGAEPDAPTRLPPIRRFIVDDGRIAVRDVQRKLEFTGAVEAKEQAGDPTHGFTMTGDGALNAQPFHLRVRGGPLLNIDHNRPYAFEGDIHAGATHVTAQGAVPKPFDLSNFWMNVSGQGPDLGDLYGLTGVPLPNSPPYDLRARLSRDGRVWKVDAISGRVGSSDLSGRLSLTGGKRPMLDADLRSHKLDFPDLGALFGGARKTGTVARALQAQQRIFPDSTLDFSKIRAIDADVRFAADQITDAPVNLRAATARIRLTAGVLRAEPLKLDLPQGQIVGFVQLNGRDKDAITDLDLRLQNGRLENLVPVKFQGAQPFVGAVVARARLHGTGDSVHDAMADANGEVMIVVPGGQIQKSIAELAGVDLIKGLGLLVAKDQSTTPIRCGVLHFTGKDGVLSADRLIVDTQPVVVQGGGFINLDKETLGFTVQGHPKSFQLVRLNVPITVSGPILSPKVGIRKGGAIVQGGIALAAGALLSPLAVLLPFVDGGLAKNADCTGLSAEAQAAGTPVSSARPAAKPVRSAR